MKQSGIRPPRRTRFKVKAQLAAVIGILSLFIFSDKASAELTIRANHDHVSIDFFYHGSAVSVSGLSDPGTDLIIKISSPDGHESLRRKGKVGGVLWMNVGSLNLEDTPKLYFLSATKKIEDILSREEMEKYTIGYQALSRHVKVDLPAPDEEKAKWFDQFVRFKESKNLYKVSQGSVSLTEKNGKQDYFVKMHWPYQATPGNYIVTVYAVRDKKVVETANADVSVEQVGVIKSLAGMAKNNGALYGMISVIAALAAGFGVGLIFRKGGGAH
jgi:uncharacterized protein (TIGR02186 family)